MADAAKPRANPAPRSPKAAPRTASPPARVPRAAAAPAHGEETAVPYTPQGPPAWPEPQPYPIWPQQVPQAPPWEQGGPANWIQVSQGPSPVAKLLAQPGVKPLLVAYLWGIVATLGLIAILFVVNIFSPLTPDTVSKVAATIFVVLGGWLWALVGFMAMTIRPLRVAGILGMAVGAAFMLFGTLDIWEFVTSYSLVKVPAALWWIQAAMAAAVLGWRFLDEGKHPIVTGLTLGGAGLGGLLHALVTLDIGLDERLADSGFWMAAGVCIGSTLFLMPDRRALRYVRGIAYGAALELAALGAISPWLEGDMVLRARAASIGITVVLGIIAATVFIIDTVKARQEAPAA